MGPGDAPFQNDRPPFHGDRPPFHDGGPPSFRGTPPHLERPPLEGRFAEDRPLPATFELGALVRRALGSPSPFSHDSLTHVRIRQQSHPPAVLVHLRMRRPSFIYASATDTMRLLGGAPKPCICKGGSSSCPHGSCLSGMRCAWQHETELDHLRTF